MTALSANQFYQLSRSAAESRIVGVAEFKPW